VIKEITVLILVVAIMFTLILCGCESKLSALSPEQTIGVTTSGGDTYNVQLTGSGAYLAIAIVALIVGVLVFFWIKADRKAIKFEKKSKDLEARMLRKSHG